LKSPSDYRGTAIARTPCYAFVRGKNVNQIDPAQTGYGFCIGRIFGTGVGMSRDKIESLMHVMNQSNLELSVSDADGESDSTEASTDPG